MTRVLVVARWYPAHDDPVRGIFVADQVRALRDAGVEVVVASFEACYLAAAPREREAERSAHRDLLLAALSRPDAALLPSAASGLPAVPVARLPVAFEAPRRPAADGAAYAEALAAFAVAEHARHPFDLLHAHSGYPDGLAAARVARRLGLPHLVTEHARSLAATFADPEQRAQYAEAAGDGRLLAVGGALAAQIRASLPHLEPEVVPNAVPLAGLPFRDTEGRRSDELLYLGHRKASKGIAVLLEALAFARARRPDLRLRLVGGASAEEDAAWRRRATELGLPEEAIRFEPSVTHDAIGELLARAALFVHPSPWETFGVVAAEALAAGLPVVATRSGGVEEVLGAARDAGPESLPGGELAPRDDPAALAAAIERALERVAHGGFDRAAMRRAAIERFDAPAVAARLVAIYGEVLAGRGDRPGATGGATGGATDATAPSPLRDGTILVLLNRVRASRLLPLLPADLRAALTVVTHPGDAPLPDVGRLVELRLGSGLGRLDRLRAALVRGSARRELAGLLAGARWVACVDGRDLAAAAASLGGSAAAGGGTGGRAAAERAGGPFLLAGGLRHLVDRWLSETSRSTSAT